MHLQHHQPCLELLRAVAHEMRPGRCPGDELAKIAHHLAAIADAQREGVASREKRRELIARPRVEQDRLRPSFARPQHIAIRKSTAGHDARISVESGATADDVAHVHVEGGESGAIERGGDFDLAVDTLLAQHRKLRPRTVGDVGHGNVVARVEAQMRRQPRVAVIEEPLEFLVSAFRIVAQALHGVARPRPRAMELDA